MNLFVGTDINDIYPNLLLAIRDRGELEAKTRELLNVAIVLKDPEKGLIYLGKNWRWAFQELFDRMSGHFVPETHYYNPGLAYKFRPAWGRKLAKEGGTFCYSYGSIIWKQLEDILVELRKHKTTREAIMVMWEPQYLTRQSDYNRRPCTLTWHFFIRQKKLFLNVNMRSNDAVNLLPYDIFHHTMLQRFVAHQLGLELGEYTHTSTHTYYPKKREARASRNYVDSVIEKMAMNRKMLEQNFPAAHVFSRFNTTKPGPKGKLSPRDINQDFFVILRHLHEGYHSVEEIKSPLLRDMVSHIKGLPTKSCIEKLK